ncbi:TrkA family potassium uptake protein [Mesobaculum littorinae]|uniref:TrkA family potassium uptake protein n=1 Tax=Mesobaculum littorinae TaxID=2486419 RepID=A0A438AIA5_9RHOB|nr:TrkA family potassium uptake protein [Mesobaculum littorinae]RVV98483.1 TrkA family potassium uptake protein [Mesobaculum littorinae]
MGRPRRTFAIIGLGNFGKTVAGELARFGNYVIGLDRDERAVEAMVDRLGQAMIVDARDDAALREAGIGDCDAALIALGNDLESSILATINCKVIGVPTIWAKAVSRTHHRILSKLGADRVMHPEELIGLHIAQMLHNPLVRDYVSLGNSYHVVNFIVPESLRGQPLSELKLMEKWELRCLGLMRGRDFVGRDGDGCVLKEDDLLILLGSRHQLRAFGASL